jgi:hypothetical protein
MDIHAGTINLSPGVKIQGTLLQDESIQDIPGSLQTALKSDSESISPFVAPLQLPCPSLGQQFTPRYALL